MRTQHPSKDGRIILTDEDFSIPARLNLLEGSEVITPRARTLTEDAMETIQAQFAAPLPAERAAQIATHVAMALTRLERGDPEGDLPAQVTDELADRHDERRLATELAAGWERALDTGVPQAEVDYLIMHLAVLADTLPGR
jgi:transcriptional regulatory protein LevR